MTLKNSCSYLVGKSTKCRSALYSILFTLCFLFVLASAGHQCYGFPIANDPGIFQVSLSASFDGTNYLVSFQENNGQTRQVSARFVSQSGSLVGSKIALGLQGGPPRVAFDGTNYFLITEEDTTSPTYIYGQFVSKAGEIMNSPFYVTSGGTAIARPSMVFDGTNYFVVWNDHQTLYGQFVSPAGDLVGSPITICSDTVSSPDVPEVYNVVSGETNILVAWADSRRTPEDPFALDIYGQLVGKSGTSTPGTLIGANFPINENNDWSDMWTIGLAYDGTNYLVAWNDMAPNSGNARLYAQRASETGTLVGDVISIGILTQNQYRPAPMLAFDGTNYLLTWLSDKNDKDHDGNCDLYEGTCWDSYAQFVSPSGQLLGSSFLIFGGGKNQFSYPIFGGGQYLLVTNSFDQFEGTSGTVTGAFLSPQHAIQTGSPRISVTPTYVNFGKLKVGGTSEMTVTIRNTGTSDLAINLIDITGINASEFCEIDNCPSLLTPGSFCTATATFAPVSFGNKTATMSISSNAPTTPTVSVKLLGSAPPPLISASLTYVNFGNVKLGGILQKTITIKNTGTSDLEISDISITGTNFSEFSQTNDCTSLPIPAGSSCTITSTFGPTLLPYGPKAALITVSSNDPKKPSLPVKLLGNTPPPKISILPTSVNFGSVQAGTTSSSKTVTVKNTGTSDLEIGGISIAGTNAAEFSQTNDCTSILPTNGFCTVTVTFLTMFTGNRNAVLGISSNDPLKPTGSVVLLGSGTIMTSGTGIWDAARWDSSTWN